MNSLKEVLMSTRTKPDVERQARLFSGSMCDDEHLPKAFEEILFWYTPEDPISISDEKIRNLRARLCKDRVYYATHNLSFSYNQPHFDIRDRLKEIGVPYWPRLDHMTSLRLLNIVRNFTTAYLGANWQSLGDQAIEPPRMSQTYPELAFSNFSEFKNYLSIAVARAVSL
jgi:hypothetical protein